MKMIAVALWWIVFFDENDGLDEDDMDIIESHNSSHLYTPEQRQENFNDNKIDTSNASKRSQEESVGDKMDFELDTSKQGEKVDSQDKNDTTKSHFQKSQTTVEQKN